MQKNGQSVKSLCIFLEIIFLLRHVTPKRPVPGSSNPIRSQNSSPNTC